MEWRDISTAPKDGTVILAYLDGNQILTVAWIRFDGDYDWFIVTPDDRPGSVRGAFSAAYPECAIPAYVDPVKWQPLPDPPS